MRVFGVKWGGGQFLLSPGSYLLGKLGAVLPKMNSREAFSSSIVERYSTGGVGFRLSFLYWLLEGEEKGGLTDLAFATGKIFGLASTADRAFKLPSGMSPDFTGVRQHI